MDRRQKKSRVAIFRAFSELLAEKNVQNITVGQIIERADVGRATFYAHFETKEYLLKALCEELFCHVFDTLEDEEGHHHIFDCDAEVSVFEHIFMHLQNNDHQLLKLLSGDNRAFFMPYFEEEVLLLVKKQADLFPKPGKLTEDYWHGFVASAFIHALNWWLANGKNESPKQMAENFIVAVTRPN